MNSKRRDKPNQAQAMHVIGDVKGRLAIVVDGMKVDTAGTLCAGAEVLLKNGASKVAACATHGVLSGPAIDRINSTEALSQVFVTDTIPLGDKLERCPKLEVVSVAALLEQNHSQHPYRFFGKRVVCIKATPSLKDEGLGTGRKPGAASYAETSRKRRFLAKLSFIIGEKSIMSYV